MNMLIFGRSCIAVAVAVAILNTALIRQIDRLINQAVISRVAIAVKNCHDAAVGKKARTRQPMSRVSF